MIVGLTGGIGSGKSTVAAMFRDLGVPVYDSDVEGKKLMTSSEAVKKAIIAAFGAEAYQGKKLNKTYLAGVVFKDKERLETLNKIVHPAVRTHFLEWVTMQNAPYVLQETALIFENNAQDKYDAVILVIAPENTRIQRVMSRDGSSRDAVEARIKNQLSDQEKISLATHLIENDTLEQTRQNVEAVHELLLIASAKESKL